MSEEEEKMDWKDSEITSELSENKYHSQLLRFTMAVVKRGQRYLSHFFIFHLMALDLLYKVGVFGIN